MIIEAYSLAESDRQAKLKLAPQIEKPIGLVEQTVNTMATVMQLQDGLHKQGYTYAEVLPINLLTRLQNELLAMKMLCESGYSVQAYSIGCTVYELSLLVPYVGKNQELAAEWFAYEGEQLFERITTLTKGALKNLYGEEAEKEWEQEYRHYKDLCAVKHSNPRVQQALGFDLVKEQELVTQTFAAGASSDAYEVERTWRLIGCCVHLILQALTSFVKNWITEEQKQGFAIEQVRKLSDELENFAKELERVYPR